MVIIRYIIKVIAAVIFVMGYINQSIAETYYAAPNGNADSCSIEIPCSLNNGLAKLNAGDTLYLRAGTYNQIVSFSTSGDPVSRITISGYPGETAIIDGYYLIPGDCYDFLVIINGSYVTFQDLKVQNSYGGGIATNGSSVQFLNVVLDRTGETGLVLGGSNNVADSVTVSRNGQRYGVGCTTWGSALATVGKNNVIQNSLTYDNKGEGLNAYGSSSNSIIQNNISYNNQSVGLYLDSSSGAIVRRNLIYYSPGWNLSSARCITIGAETGQASNLQIVNNVIMNGFVNIETDSNLTRLDNVMIANNTIVNARGDDASGYNMGVYYRPNLNFFSNSFFVNNIVIEESPTRVPISVPSLHNGLTFSNNLWNKTPTMYARGDGDVIGDPKISKTGLIGPGQLSGSYFKILSDSIARDKGNYNINVVDDYFGNPRPFGLSPDIGAHEFIDSSFSIKPPANLRIFSNVH